MIKKYNYKTSVYDLNFVTKIIEEPQNLIEVDISFFNITILHSIFKNSTKLKELILPESITEISREAFKGCTSLQSIEFKGTIKQWNGIKKGDNWNYGSSITKILCKDGTLMI